MTVWIRFVGYKRTKTVCVCVRNVHKYYDQRIHTCENNYDSLEFLIFAFTSFFAHWHRTPMKQHTESKTKQQKNRFTVGKWHDQQTVATFFCSNAVGRHLCGKWESFSCCCCCLICCFCVDTFIRFSLCYCCFCWWWTRSGRFIRRMPI